jgi:Branched-chain amino acid transport system / permease component
VSSQPTGQATARNMEGGAWRGLNGLRIRKDLVQRGASLGAFAVLVLFCSVTFPAFASLGNFRNILTFSSILFIIALGQTLVVLGRGVDLSVGSMVGLAGAVFARMVVSGVQLPLAIVLTLVLALLLGAIVNGMLITKARISFFIVTLGTFSLFRSQAQVLLGGEKPDRQITVPVGAGQWSPGPTPERRLVRDDRLLDRIVRPAWHDVRPLTVRDGRESTGGTAYWHPHRPSANHQLRDLRAPVGHRGPADSRPDRFCATFGWYGTGSLRARGRPAGWHPFLRWTRRGRSDAARSFVHRDPQQRAGDCRR